MNQAVLTQVKTTDRVVKKAEDLTGFLQQWVCGSVLAAAIGLSLIKDIATTGLEPSSSWLT